MYFGVRSYDCVQGVRIGVWIYSLGFVDIGGFVTLRFANSYVYWTIVALFMMLGINALFPTREIFKVISIAG